MRIVILFAKAGGGHESCAKALKSEIIKQNPEINVELIDILAKSPKWQQDLFCASYVFFTDKIPLVWSFLQILWKIDFLANLTAIPLKLQIQNYLKEILDSKPDKIICTYFLVDKWLQDLQISNQNLDKTEKKLTQNLPENSDQNAKIDQKTISQSDLQNLQNISKNNSKLNPNSNPNSKTKIPIWTVVTDLFSPHSVWFIGKNCNYLVFSERAKLAAINRTVLPEKIVEFGVFFGEKFEKIGTKLEIENWKTELLKTPEIEVQKLQNNLQNSQNYTENYTQIPTLLVVGGGESMPNGSAILEEILKLQMSFNLIFVCGRNEKLRQKCDKIVAKWQENQAKIDEINSQKTNKFPKNIQILGFTTRLYEFINISDLVICKAGPATILEVISQQKPFLISHFIWEQEIGNRDFAVTNGVAIYENNPQKLAQKIQNLLSNAKEIDKMTQNYQNFKIQNDLPNITKFLISDLYTQIPPNLHKNNLK